MARPIMINRIPCRKGRKSPRIPRKMKNHPTMRMPILFKFALVAGIMVCGKAKNQPIRLSGLKPGVCSGLILSGAFNPDLKIGGLQPLNVSTGIPSPLGYE
jgi:hypothetical protein